MIDTQRRRILRALNRRWIYGQVVSRPSCLPLSTIDGDGHRHYLIEGPEWLTDGRAATPSCSRVHFRISHGLDIDPQIQRILCGSTRYVPFYRRLLPTQFADLDDM